MFALTLVLACIFMGAFGQISLKKGMNEIGRINNLSELFNVKNLFMMFNKYAHFCWNRFICLGNGFMAWCFISTGCELYVSFIEFGICCDRDLCFHIH